MKWSLPFPVKLGGLVLATGLAARIIFLISVDTRSLVIQQWGGSNYHDAYDYDRLARNLLEHRVYGYGQRSSSYRAPGYPWFLAGIYAILGTGAVRTVQVILGAFTCLLLFLITRELFPLRNAFWAGLASALYPFFIFFNVQILTETLFMFLTAVSFYSIIKHLRTGKQFYGIAGGISWGMGALTRPVLLPLTIIPLAGYFFTHYKKPGTMVRPAILFLAGVIITVIPWSIRNYRVQQEWVFISTNGGYNFYLGSAGYQVWSGKGRQDNNIPNTTVLTDTDIEQERILCSETEAGRSSTAAALVFIRNNPFTFIKIMLLKIYDYWHIMLSGVYPWWARVLAALIYGGVMVSGLTGLLYTAVKQRDPFSWMVCVFLVSATLIHAVFISNIRMRVPLVDPILIIYSGFGLNRISVVLLRRYIRSGG